MVGEVFAGIGALKAAFDMSKAIVDISDAAKRDRLSINLQKEILSAQSAQADLIEEVRELKEKLAGFEKWETEKERYQLCSPAKGFVVYALKKTSANGEPPHWLCTDCYENRKKAFLKAAGPAGPFGEEQQKTLWKCHVCDSSIRAVYNIQPSFVEDTIELKKE